MPPQELPSQPDKPATPPSGNVYPWPQREDAPPPPPPLQPLPTLPLQQSPPVTPAVQSGSVGFGGDAAPSAVKRSGRSPLAWLAFVLICLVVLIGCATGFLVWKSYQDNPTRILRLALDNSLSTAQWEQQTTASGLKSTSQYHLGANNPLVSTTASIKLYGSSFSLQSYGSLQNGYLKYTKLPSGVQPDTSKAVLGTWVQLRQGGVLPAGVSQTLTSALDTRAQFFGPLPVGDFSQQTRTELVNDLLNTGVYQYQTAGVTKTMLDGTPAMVYHATENLNALTKFYELIAASEGLHAADVDTTMKTLYSSQPANITLYIQPNTHQVLRLDFTQVGSTSTTLYQFGDSTFAAAPASSLSWAQFAPQQAALESQVALQQSNNQRDAERVNDINELRRYIENYHTANGSYPSLANLNNQVWVSANMQGLDPDTFKDPQGSSVQLAPAPAADVYAYMPLSTSGGACNNETTAKGAAPCATYTLTATLSTGKTYSVENVQ